MRKLKNILRNKRGDITTNLSILVFLGCFLGFWGFLITLMPPTLAEGPTQFIGYSYPEGTFEGVDVTNFLDTNTTSFGNFVEDWNMGGHDMSFMADKAIRACVNWHYYGFFQSHQMEWINDEGISRGKWLYQSEITLDHDENNVSAYTLHCSHFHMRAWFDYNTTAYSSFEDAWDNNGAQVLFAINFDQAGTAWNGFGLIAELLRFQAPSIHPLLNLVVALPIWIAIALFIVLLISLILPFVG